MSGLSIPQSLKTLFTSKLFSRRWRERASSRKARQRMLLLVENLERRELMAADIGYNQMHNALVPTDVNGDFAITPIDVLQVINALNRSSSGSGDGSSALLPMTDVNNDGITSPIDALMVINRLKTGEGVGELAEIGFQVLDANGTPLTPTGVVGGLPEYTLGFNQAFTVRTRAKDIRASGRTGVAIVYTDLSYSTAEGSTPTDDIVKVQWGEYQTIRVGSNVVSGTFTLTYGSETTAPITYDEDGFVTRENIRNAIGALGFSGGIDNIVVEDVLFEANSQDKGYGISFTNGRRRTDVPDATLGSNNLVGTGGAAVSFSVTSSSNPNNANVLGAAISSPVNTGAGGSTFIYNSGKKQGRLVTDSSTSLRLDDVGNFLGAQPNLASSTAFFNIFDTAFRTSSDVAGAANFTIGSANSSSLGIGLFGRDTSVPDSLVLFPTNPSFRIRVAGAVQANGDSRVVDEDSAATPIDVLANDIVADGGGPLTISAVTQPVGGSVALINGSTGVSFTPAPNFFGTTSFTYTATNSLGSGTATVVVEVNPINDPPVARVESLVAAEGSSNNVYSSTDLFPSPGAGETGGTITLSNPALVAGQTGGTISLVGNTVVFNGTPGFNGNVLFTATGTDNGNAATTSTFTISVTPFNDPPVAILTNLSTNEDTVLNVSASQLFSPGPADEASQSLTFKSVEAVVGQSGVSIGAIAGGNVSFSPVSNFSGTFVFTAVVTDNGAPNADSATSTITLTVNPVNDAPTANNDVLNAFAGAVVELEVLTNDTSGPGENDNLVITGIGPNQGSATITADGKRIRYTAPVSLIGSSETFSYTINDGGLEATANVQVLVASPTLPFAIVDSLEIAENAPKAAIRVLDNDLFNSGETKRLEASTVVLTPSTLGTVERNTNNTPDNLSDDFFEFTPAPNANGTGSFTYLMSDTKVGSESSIGTVNITVTEVNTKPTAANKSVNGTEDTVLNIPLATFREGATAGINEANQVLSIASVAMVNGAQGTVELVEDGTVVRFTPAINANGPVLFTYVLRDNGTTAGIAAPMSSDPATVTVNVAAVNDAPIAGVDTFSVAEDTTLTRPLANLLTNDSSGPANESDLLQVTSVAMAAGSTGTIAISGSNFVYTPVADFNGTVVATYVVRDNGNPAAQSTGTITINVTEVNDAPGAVNATREAFVGSTVTINLASELAQASRGPANESSQTVRINRIVPRSGSSANEGTVTLNSDGTISYTPSASVTEQIVDVFQYEIIDNGTTNGTSDPKTGIGQVSVTVRPFQSSTVQGRIWIDDNNSGGYDRPELFMQGVLVTLSGRPTGASQDIASVTSRTDNAGNYSFSNVRPGNYTVSFAKPAFTIDAPEAEQQSFSISVPGNQTVNADFRILAVSTVNNVLWDNLLSNYYRRNGQEWAHRGFTALVGANGASQWNIRRGGFESYSRVDVSMNAQGIPQIDAYFVNAQGNMQHSRASVPRSRFLSVGVDGGNTLVHVFAMPEDLAFTNLSATPAVNAEGFGYESVDGIFANDQWL